MFTALRETAGLEVVKMFSDRVFLAVAIYTAFRTNKVSKFQKRGKKRQKQKKSSHFFLIGRILQISEHSQSAKQHNRKQCHHSANSSIGAITAIFIVGTWRRCSIIVN
ncbi:MAG: hypothetical protein LBJ13_04255 [Puniceicoccales bacterium]|nr:hypothetical protein [Puniceicoccales bacterium]